jgi:hypothetical protein
MSTIEPRMVSIFKHVLQSHLHTSFWCSSLDSHLTTYYSNMCVQIIAMFELGTSTLVSTFEHTWKITHSSTLENISYVELNDVPR